MEHDSDAATVPATSQPVATRSAAAERMRMHRERRRQGLRCLMIELRETELDALIRLGLLKPELREDPEAVCEGLYAHFERTLGSAA